MQSTQAIIPENERNNNEDRSKKSSSNFKPNDLEKVKSLAVVIYDDDIKRASDNKVHVSPRLYKELFGEEEDENKYVMIANKVFPAVVDHDLHGKKVDLSPVQYNQVDHAINEREHGNSVVVRSFKPDEIKIPMLDKIQFHVETAGTMNSLMDAKNKPAILTRTLGYLIHEQLGDQILTREQELFIKHPAVGPLKLTVTNWDFVNYRSDKPLSDEFLPYYGELSFFTEIKFSIDRSENLALLEEIDSKKLREFTFTINKVENVSEREFTARKIFNNDSWKKGAQPLPLVVPLNELSKSLREQLKGVPIFPEHKEDIVHSEDWLYTLELSKVTLKRGVKDEWKVNQSNIQRAFKLDKSHKIVVKPNTQVILTKNIESAKTAESVTFEVIDTDLTYTTQDNEVPWLSVEEIIEQIRDKQKTFAIGSKVVIELEQGKFLLQVKKANELNPKRNRRSNLKELWKLNEKTNVKVYPNSRLDIEIVDSPKPYKIDSMRITVDIPNGSSSVGGFFGLLGEEKKTKKTKVSEEEIEKIFKHTLPLDKTVIKDQTLTAITDAGKKITFKIKEITSEQKGSGKAEYKHLYEVDKETKLSFHAEKDGGLIISKKPLEITYDGIGKKMKELGVGGMPDQFLDIITKVILTRTKYASHAKKMGQKPPRGILLYGPPGTGKTILARKLGEILGVSQENTQLITGSNVWSKWLGDSEKKVRELFSAAREDQELYGKDSPLHLIIIDEIDAFLQSRESATQRYETSVLNTFLAELDGISGQGEGSLDNVIVVGLTNYPDKLDAAVVRPGRLGTQIHIGLPDSKGRKEIFEIHSKRIQETGCLAEDVDLDEIAKMTVGRTGAFIEGMVKVAASYSIKRLFEQQVDVEKDPDHPAAKVTMEDFKNAFHTSVYKDKAVKKMLNKFVPSDSISVADVRNDLKKLGVAGIPENVLDALVDIKLRQANSRLLQQSKVLFPQGLFLYGPSNTGKTKLAMAMKDLFELDGERFQYFSASHLFKLKANDLKDKIEKIIKPAQNAAKDLKEDAPLHVVVVDEMDELFWMNREKQSDVSVMNLFLKELESILGEDGGHLNNLLVVGIGRRRFKLNDAILSHGRFGQHIAIDYPKAKERKDLFKHFLEKLEVEDNIVKELVEKTKDRSPGFIEGLVGEAQMFMLRKGDKVLKLTHFEDAYIKMTKDEPNLNYHL